MPIGARGWARRVVVALAVAVTLVMVAVVYWSAPSPQWTGVPLGGLERSMGARSSPVGHWLALAGVVGEVWQVAVMKPESGNLTVLTHAIDKGNVNSLCWSMDGTKIYYDRVTDVPRGIYSVPVLGGEEHLVVEDASGPEALPDGSLLVARLNATRQLQLTRYWPETGHWKTYPLTVSAISNGVARSFPDGLEVVAFGTATGPAAAAGVRLYAIDLESGKLRRLYTGGNEDPNNSAVAVARDGKSVLAAVIDGNQPRVIGVPRIGHSSTRKLGSLTNTVFSLDVGVEGSIYLDQIERHLDVLRFSAGGGHAEKIATLLPYQAPGKPWLANESFAVLPDGRAVIPQGAGGGLRLTAVEAGKPPVALVATAEETSAPVTAAGSGEIAFLIGKEPRRTIATASVSNGRITKRIPFDRGPITALTASPDGKTLYCAAGGMVWAIAVAGGEARKLRPGDYLAMDPAGKYLLVQVSENPIIRLIQVPLDGGAEREVPHTAMLRPAFMITPNAISQDGRVLIPMGASTWNWPAGIMDLRTGEVTQIPVDYKTEFHALSWTPDGKVIAMGLDLRAKLWKFRADQ